MLFHGQAFDLDILAKSDSSVLAQGTPLSPEKSELPLFRPKLTKLWPLRRTGTSQTVCTTGKAVQSIILSFWRGKAHPPSCYTSCVHLLTFQGVRDIFALKLLHQALAVKARRFHFATKVCDTRAKQLLLQSKQRSSHCLSCLAPARPGLKPADQRSLMSLAVKVAIECPHMSHSRQ